MPFLHFTNDVPFPRDPGRKHVEWKNRNRARATNPFVASQKSIFALVSELLKYLNMDNGIWMGRQYCWHWTIAFNWQKSQYREWILKHCFGWEWTLSIELPMSWKGEGNLVLIFDIFEVLRKDTLLLICQRMRVGFRNNSSDWSLALICKYLDFDSWECLLERLLRFVNVSMRDWTLVLILNIENAI